MALFRLSVLLLFALVPFAAIAAAPALIPIPASTKAQDGEFRITQRVRGVIAASSCAGVTL